MLVASYFGRQSHATINQEAMVTNIGQKLARRNFRPMNIAQH